MASPATLGSIGIGANVAGGILGAEGSIASGEAQQGMYNYQAGVAQLNATIAKQNADFAVNAGEEKAQQYGLEAGQRQGQIVASQASSGLDANSGSAKEVQQSQKMVTNLDLTQIRSDANKTAYDIENQAQGFEEQATLDTMAGKNAAQAGVIGAFSSILGTASSVCTKWPRPATCGSTSLNGKPSSLFAGTECWSTRLTNTIPTNLHPHRRVRRGCRRCDPTSRRGVDPIRE